MVPRTGFALDLQTHKAPMTQTSLVGLSDDGEPIHRIEPRAADAVTNPTVFAG